MSIQHSHASSSGSKFQLEGLENRQLFADAYALDTKSAYAGDILTISGPQLEANAGYSVSFAGGVAPVTLPVISSTSSTFTVMAPMNFDAKTKALGQGKYTLRLVLPDGVTKAIKNTLDVRGTRAVKGTPGSITLSILQNNQKELTQARDAILKTASTDKAKKAVKTIFGRLTDGVDAQIAGIKSVQAGKTLTIPTSIKGITATLTKSSLSTQDRVLSALTAAGRSAASQPAQTKTAATAGVRTLATTTYTNPVLNAAAVNVGALGTALGAVNGVALATGNVPAASLASSAAVAGFATMVVLPAAAATIGKAGAAFFNAPEGQRLDAVLRSDFTEELNFFGEQSAAFLGGLGLGTLSAGVPSAAAALVALDTTVDFTGGVTRSLLDAVNGGVSKLIDYKYYARPSSLPTFVKFKRPSATAMPSTIHVFLRPKAGDYGPAADGVNAYYTQAFAKRADAIRQSLIKSTRLNWTLMIDVKNGFSPEGGAFLFIDGKAGGTTNLLTPAMLSDIRRTYATSQTGYAFSKRTGVGSGLLALEAEGWIIPHMAQSLGITQ